MSKTVRFKLAGVEAKYVTDTINALHSRGLLGEGGKSIPDIAKGALMEFCIGINKRAREYAEKMEAEQEVADAGDRDTGEGDTEDGQEDGTVGSDESTEQKVVHTEVEGD